MIALKLARITPDDLKRRMDAHQPIAILDTRAEDAWNESDVQIPGAMRVPPDAVARHLPEIPRDRLAVTYCT
jgi:rhodanese-related sulfurtransferase